MDPIIKIRNLDVIYFLGKSNEVHALKDINLEIYSGEFIIFFGPSGCGKSTLLYSIAGLERNIHGHIFIDKSDLAQMKAGELEEFHREKMGMIFQAYYLIASLSVLNNVILPQVFLKKSLREERKKRAMELMEHFGVARQADKLPNELSGGQQQRVAICRSLMNNPDLIFADEPVGNLDSKSSDEVMALLSELNENQKKTIILVTHNPEHLRYAHRIFFMKDGRLIETKVNKVVDRRIENLVKQEEKVEQKPAVSKELELLLRTYSGLSSAQAGSLLVPFKAKQIALEALLGMTTEEIEQITKRVEYLLLRGIDNSDELYKFLDMEIAKGGMGFDKRTAEKLYEKIKSIVTEIKYLEAQEIEAKQNKLIDTEEEIVQVRQYLLDAFDMEIQNLDVLKIFDNAVKQRIENVMDRGAFEKVIDMPLKRGGAGLNRRMVKKISSRLELLILGKYK